MIPPLETLFALLAVHCLLDYAAQGDFMAQAKNRNTAAGKQLWVWVLPSHGLIHGGGVFLVTGSVWLGIAETVAHTVIDFLKCDNRISYSADQTAHAACKLLWVVVLMQGVDLVDRFTKLVN